MNKKVSSILPEGFRPLSGILFLFAKQIDISKDPLVSVPCRGFYFYSNGKEIQIKDASGFRPLSGILFLFVKILKIQFLGQCVFPSPVGDFIFIQHRNIAKKEHM